MTKVEKKSRDQEAKLVNSRRANLGWFFGFLIVFGLIDLFGYPFFLDWLVKRLPSYEFCAFDLTRLETDKMLFLNWGWCFNPISRTGGYERMLITISLQFVFVAFLIKLYFGTHKGSLSAGVEHGSARMITDEEFNQLIPSCIFYKDEQDRLKNPETKLPSIDDSYKPNIFDNFEFEEE